MLKNTSSKFILLIIFSGLLFSAVILINRYKGEKSSDPTSKKSPRKFQEMGRQGVNYFIYTPFKDEQTLQDICKSYKDKGERIIQITFFDAKPANTSWTFPMSDSLMAHLLAVYNFNSNTGFEKLKYINK